MKLSLFKPQRGWRQLGSEVGIIVLGVLIALGAEQIVRSIDQRAKVRELRAAVDNEIAYGLGTYANRVEQDGCLNARLEELDRWLQGWRDGRPQSLIAKIAAPLSSPPHTSVWASRDPEVMSHMTLSDKLRYGDIYDEFANNEVQRLDERMTWLALAEYDAADRLDLAAKMRLQGLITRARWRARNITDNAGYITHTAKQMGIKPAPEAITAAKRANLCRPILPPG